MTQMAEARKRAVAVRGEARTAFVKILRKLNLILTVFRGQCRFWGAGNAGPIFRVSLYSTMRKNVGIEFNLNHFQRGQYKDDGPGNAGPIFKVY